MRETPPSDRDREQIAPEWHTATLIALYLLVALTGVLLQRRGVSTSALPTATGRIVGVYLPFIVAQWSLTLYVCRIGRPRNALRSLLGPRAMSVKQACVDVALAAGAWLIIKSIEFGWSRLSTSGHAPFVDAMLPHGVLECLTWVVVSVSAGFCEEVVFRGYFLTQFEAFWGRWGAAVIAQAALFGLAHGEQGAAAVARTALYGAGFGALAHWRRSLAPGIVCHVWTDLASGLLRV